MMCSLWLACTAQEHIFFLTDRFAIVLDSCSPALSTYVVNEECHRVTSSWWLLIVLCITQVVFTILSAILSATYAKLLYRLKDEPLDDTVLQLLYNWCTADGDEKVSLEEFELYHQQILHITETRLRLLRANFVVCDIHEAGCVPLRIFSKIYTVTFGGQALSHINDLQEAERSVQYRRASRLRASVAPSSKQRCSVVMRRYSVHSGVHEEGTSTASSKAATNILDLPNNVSTEPGNYLSEGSADVENTPFAVEAAGDEGEMEELEESEEMIPTEAAKHKAENETHPKDAKYRSPQLLDNT